MITTNTLRASIDYTTATLIKEKLATLQEFCDMYRLKAGQKILLGEIDFDKNTTYNTKTICIGDDLNIDEDVNRNLYVLEVVEVD